MLLQTLEGDSIMDITRSYPKIPGTRRVVTPHFALYGSDDYEGSTVGPLGGWLTDLKKGASKAVRSAGSVVMDVGRSVAPIVGTAVGSGLKAAGLVPSLPGAGTDVAQSAQIPGGLIQYVPDPQTQPVATTPTWVMPAAFAGGALLLVLALKK